MSDPVLSLLVSLLGLSGLLPLALLFVDYRKRRHIHKPFIYLFIFVGFWVLLATVLLKQLGLWLALIAPFALFGYVAAMRWAWRKR